MYIFAPLRFAGFLDDVFKNLKTLKWHIHTKANYYFSMVSIHNATKLDITHAMPFKVDYFETISSLLLNALLVYVERKMATYSSIWTATTKFLWFILKTTMSFFLHRAYNNIEMKLCCTQLPVTIVLYATIK